MTEAPILYQKVIDFLKDTNFKDIPIRELNLKLCREFRVSADDIRPILKELKDYGVIDKITQRTVKMNKD